MDNIHIQDGLIVDEPFILITYTTGFGQVPPNVLDFLKNNHKYLIGVAASGNRNWADSYCASADIIANQYNVPIISKFELFGTKTDVEYFKKRVSEIEAYRIK
jgi:protein involved in ribonucleotide reduction